MTGVHICSFEAVDLPSGRFRRTMTTTLPAIPVLDVELNLIRKGKKTQIRFPIEPQPGEAFPMLNQDRTPRGDFFLSDPIYTRVGRSENFCPYGKPGDRLTCFPDLVVEITDVRVQRLGDISEEDALAEGVPAKKAFRFLWDVTRRKVAQYDPALWVWAITLRRIDA